MKMRRFVGGVATVWFTCAVVGSPVLASTLPSVPPDQQLDQWLDRQADRTQPWDWRVGQEIERALRRGHGDRSDLQQYVREAMLGWEMHCPARVVAGEPIPVRLDLAESRLAQDSLLRVVLGNAQYFVDGRLQFEQEYPVLGSVGFQRPVEVPSPIEPGTYTVTVEATVGALLARHDAERNRSRTVPPGEESVVWDEIRLDGAGPDQVRWSTTIEVVAPDAVDVFSIHEPGLAAEIAAGITSLWFERRQIFGDRVEATLKLEMTAPVPIAHDLVVRRGATEVVIGAVRSGLGSRVEYRSTAGEPAGEHWGPHLHIARTVDPRSEPSDFERLMAGDDPVALVFRPNPSYLAGTGVSVCWTGEFVIEDVNVLTPTESREREIANRPAPPPEIAAQLATHQAQRQAVRDASPAFTAYRDGTASDEQTATVLRTLRAVFGDRSMAHDRVVNETIEIARQRGDLDVAELFRAMMASTHEIGVRDRVRHGESLVVDLGRRSAMSRMSMSAQPSKAKLIIGGNTVWQSDEPRSWPQAVLTVPDFEGVRTPLKLEITYRDHANNTSLGTVTYEKMVHVVGADEPVVLIDDAVGSDAVRDAITYGGTWIAHGTDGSARAVVDLTVSRPTIGVAYDVMLSDGDQEWCVNVLTCDVGGYAESARRTSWVVGGDVSGIGRDTDALTLRLVPSVAAAERTGTISTIAGGTIDFGAVKVRHVESFAAAPIEWLDAQDSGASSIDAIVARLDELDTDRLVMALRAMQPLIDERLTEPSATVLQAHTDLLAEPDTGASRLVFDRDVRRFTSQAETNGYITFAPEGTRQARGMLSVQRNDLHAGGRPAIILPIDVPSLATVTRADLPEAVTASAAEIAYAERNSSRRRLEQTRLELGRQYALRSINEGRSDVLVVFEVVDRDAWTVTVVWRRLEYTDLMRRR